MFESPGRRAALLFAVFASWSARASDAEPRDTLLVDSADVPTPRAALITGSIDPAFVDKSIAARLLSPVTGSIALGVSSTFDDLRTLDPSPSLRYQFLSQEKHGISLTGIVRYKSTGFFSRTGEVQAGVSVARRFGRLQMTANGVVGSASNGTGMDVDAKFNTSWRLTEHTLIGVDARIRGDLFDSTDVEARANPNARDFELTMGPALSWQLGVVQLQGLLGVLAPKGAGPVEPVGMALASFGF